MKNAQVARELGIHPHTLWRNTWPSQGPTSKTALHQKGQRRHRTLGGLHLKAVERRLSQCALQIHREKIAGQGYPGAYQNVLRITRYLKEQEEVLGEPLPDTSPGISSAALRQLVSS
jgi:transposase-like protein